MIAFRISLLPQNRFRKRITQTSFQHIDAAEINQRLPLPIPERQGCDAFPEQTAIDSPEALRQLTLTFKSAVEQAPGLDGCQGRRTAADQHFF